MTKLFSSLTLSFMVLFFTGSLPLFADYGIVTAKSGLNIREKADSKSRVVIAIPFKSKIEITETTKVKETVKGKEGVWLKVSYYDLIKDRESSGYALSSYVFSEHNAEFSKVCEDFLKTAYSLDVKKTGNDDLHWKILFKLKDGTFAPLFENDGDAEKGRNDYFLCNYFPQAEMALFNNNSPDYWLADLTSGRIQILDYGQPDFNSKGTSYFDWSSGGMFGSHFVIYEFTSRIPQSRFSLEESDLAGWDQFHPSWKDDDTVEISYYYENSERRFQIKRSANGWIRGTER